MASRPRIPHVSNSRPVCLCVVGGEKGLMSQGHVKGHVGSCAATQPLRHCVTVTTAHWTRRCVVRALGTLFLFYTRSREDESARAKTYRVLP